MTLEDIKQLEYDLINNKMIIVLKARIYHKKRMIDKMSISCDWSTFCDKCQKFINYKNSLKNI